ncbi:UNVERIFIED_CONTAM: hypothetical protein Cloal_2295 [Acetivibrio alkalicellulosi]
MEKLIKIPKRIVIAVLSYLAITWTMVIFIDFLNIGGSSDWLVSKNMNNALLWVHFFTEGSPTEMFQWFFISVSVLACGVISGLHIKKSELSKCFMMIGLGMAIMLMEDAGNIRHLIARLVSILFYDEYSGSGSNPYATGTIVLIYSILGFLMVFPLIKYRGQLLSSVKSKSAIRWFVIGYFAYGFASVVSATEQMGNWVGRVGAGIIDYFSLTERAAWHSRELGFYLLDFLVEESIELIGASFIFAALLSYALSLIKDMNTVQSESKTKVTS